ncbi:MAG: hypothetical protein JWO67_835 [Streptosporangiaceae bacterium]|nr:hypothetical protein [Streptosporangiaceae bacterium]
MKVRTTFHPDLEVEVNAAELLDLQRAGLIVPDPAPQPAAPAPAAAPAPVPPAATPAAAPAAVNTTKEGA